MDKSKHAQESKTKNEDWSPRKSAPFINLSKSSPDDRKIKVSYKRDTKYDNIEKIQFKCQPKSKNPDHSSLENISPNLPVKELVYRLIVNNRKPMKLGDIADRAYEILRKRKPPFTMKDKNIYQYFYRLLTEDSYYGYEEVD
jgi:hypothetical protein